MHGTDARIDDRTDERVENGIHDGLARRPVSRHGIRIGTRVLAWGTVALLVLLAAPPRDAAADLGCYRCPDPTKVYFGNPKLFQKPAVIAADRVYREIAEYREILEKGLTDRDVRYHFLMKKASERFSKAVKAMARAEGHDLVAETGAVEATKGECPAPPDRTSDVISELG